MSLVKATTEPLLTHLLMAAYNTKYLSNLTNA